jgi:hypothetical protein
VPGGGVVQGRADQPGQRVRADRGVRVDRVGRGAGGRRSVGGQFDSWQAVGLSLTVSAG